NVVPEVLKYNMSDLDGKPRADIETVFYNTSVARCSDKDKQYIYNTIPLQSYAGVVGEDHMYFFAFNSFGNNLDLAAQLADYIQQVKDETGHDKVNIIPISLGGSIVNSLYEFHMDEIKDSIDRIVNVISASNGSRIVADLYIDAFNKEEMYSELWPSLMDGYTGYLLNIVLRMLGKNFVNSFVDSVMDAARNHLLLNCLNMWGLSAAEEYPQIRAQYLMDEKYDNIRVQADKVYLAKIKRFENLSFLIDNYGVKVYNMVDYSVPLYRITKSFFYYNTDAVVDIYSTSFGCTSVPKGQKLAPGYVQPAVPTANAEYLDRLNNGEYILDFETDTAYDWAYTPYCTCADLSKHLSPDGEVDASTGLLPDHTWYFYEMNHERTGSSDTVLKNALFLLFMYDGMFPGFLADDYDVFYELPDVPERYVEYNHLPLFGTKLVAKYDSAFYAPQYNHFVDGRSGDLTYRVNDAIDWLNANEATAAADIVAKIQAATDDAIYALKTPTMPISKFNQTKADLEAALYGPPGEPVVDKMELFLTKFFKGISDFLNRAYG
ncbi:MAG: hypothetical protein FWF08_04230, partial [Oscillospiraceae bacterium]|nr:hypothetical protein [Oscillospiraceae bacterium]